MHELKDLLENLTLVLGVAAIISFLFHKLRQPLVLGYIIAGMIVGPHIPIPLVANSDIIHTLSELGVILLMFSLGLEFKLRKFFRVLPTAGIIALIQCSLMMWLGYVVGIALGWTSVQSIYAGAIVAISSTTIIIKVFSDKGIRDKVSEIVFGVLIVEDLIAIFLMAFLPALSKEGAETGWIIARTAGALFMFLVTLLVGGLLIIPRVLRGVIRANKPEITLVVSLGICFALSVLAKEMGYSVALGAFLAGSLMAEAGDDGAVHNLILPVRDMFAAIFFVSVGMIIDPVLIYQNWVSVLIFTGIVIFGKFIGVGLGTFLTGNTVHTSVRVGMSLAQIGEFSFIIAGIGLATKGTSNLIYTLAVAVSALTTITTPWFINRSNFVAGWIDRHLPQPLQTFSTLYTTWIQQIKQGPKTSPIKLRFKRLMRSLLIDISLLIAVVIGTKLSIDILVSHLSRLTGLPQDLSYAIGVGVVVILAAPLVWGIIRSIRSLGFVLANQALPEQEAGKLDLAAAPRRVLVVTLQLVIVLLIGLPFLALTQPFLPAYAGVSLLLVIFILLGISFWKSTVNLEGHVRAGTEVIVEMLGKPLDKQKPIEAPQIDSFLPGLGFVASVPLDPQSPILGQTLLALNLRAMLGVNVIAIKRKGGVIVPKRDDKLLAGDILTLTGSEEAIQSAKQFIQSFIPPKVS